ncbi:hypothetical protein B0H14DRAFT_3151524 [Mycena olivaceomarginata]|nr:hypothetical protein B0H14DRAFT_3151524 [Mycena olivaceomarginata]
MSSTLQSTDWLSTTKPLKPVPTVNTGTPGAIHQKLDDAVYRLESGSVFRAIADQKPMQLASEHSWTVPGSTLAVGTTSGRLHVYDAERLALRRTALDLYEEEERCNDRRLILRTYKSLLPSYSTSWVGVTQGQTLKTKLSAVELLAFVMKPSTLRSAVKLRAYACNGIETIQAYRANARRAAAKYREKNLDKITAAAASHRQKKQNTGKARRPRSVSLLQADLETDADGDRDLPDNGAGADDCNDNRIDEHREFNRKSWDFKNPPKEVFSAVWALWMHRIRLSRLRLHLLRRRRLY